jgi:hypothetical protein
MGGGRTRIHLFIGVVLTWVIASGASAIASGTVVRIRIYDYVHLSSEAIARAQALVTRIYRSIGVQSCWTHTAPPPELQCSESESADIHDLFVILLDSEMSDRLPVADDVAGMAAVAATGGGRIAYVFFERVTLAAKGTGVDPMDVLGLVMAHEIGHLLLPAKAHSLTGLMRPRWHIAEFREGRLSSQFRFTDAEAALIRQGLQGGAASASAALQPRDSVAAESGEPAASMVIRP